MKKIVVSFLMFLMSSLSFSLDNHLYVISKDNIGYVIRKNGNSLYQEIITSNSGKMIEQIKVSNLEDRNNYEYLEINNIIYFKKYSRKGNTEIHNNYIKVNNIVLNLYLIDSEKTEYRMNLHEVKLENIDNQNLSDSLLNSSENINVYEYAFTNIKINEYLDEIKLNKKQILKELITTKFDNNDLEKIKQWKEKQNIKSPLYIDRNYQYYDKYLCK